TPAGLAARIERLERLAGLDSTARAPEVGVAGSAGQPPPNPRSANDADHLGRSPETIGAPAVPGPVPHAPNAEALDIQTIRRSWPTLLERLAERRQMILRANLESVTAASYDGATLELAFPPGRKFSVQKVQDKEPELREIFFELFGVSPRIRCVARTEVPGVELVEEDEPPATREDAVA